MVNTWTAAEWGGFLTAAGAALVLLVKTCFSGMSEAADDDVHSEIDPWTPYL